MNMKYRVLFVIMATMLSVDALAINCLPGKYEYYPDSKADEVVEQAVLQERQVLQRKMSAYALALVAPMQQAYERQKAEPTPGVFDAKGEGESSFSKDTTAPVSKPVPTQVKKTWRDKLSCVRAKPTSGAFAKQKVAPVFGAASGGAYRAGVDLAAPSDAAGQIFGSGVALKKTCEHVYAQTKTDGGEVAMFITSRWVEDRDGTGQPWKRANNVLDGVGFEKASAVFECETPGDFVLKIIIENFVQQCFHVDFPQDHIYNTDWWQSLGSPACVKSNICEVLGFWFAKDWLARKKEVDDFCQTHPQAQLLVEFVPSVKAAFYEDLQRMRPHIDEFQIIETKVWAKDAAGNIISQESTKSDSYYRYSSVTSPLPVCYFETLFHINMNRGINK